jgi:hypothetical protein
MQKTVMMMHTKLLNAFKKVKSHVFELKSNVSINNDVLLGLRNNQRKLLARIKELEKKVEQKPKVITKTKVVKKVVKEVVKVSRRKEYVGAKTSMKLHQENCPFAKNIKRANKVRFKSKVKPFNLGYSACDCLK